MSKNTPIFKLLYRYIFSFLVFAIVFLTPLVFVTNTKEAFEFPKMYFVYFLGATLVTYWVITNLLKQPLSNIVKKLRINTILKLYLASFVVSVVFSSHIYTSFWGYYSRFNGGLVSLLVFLGIFLVFRDLHTIYKGQSEVMQDKIKGILISSLIPISLYAILQHNTLGVDVRVYSTFGQPNWLGAYIATLLPLVISKILQKKDKKHEITYILIFLISYMALWYTYSVSSLLAFVTGTGALILFKSDQIKQNIYKLFLMTIAIILVSISSPGLFRQKVNDIFLDIQKANNTKVATNNAIEIIDTNVNEETAVDDMINSQNSEKPKQQENYLEQEEQLSDPGFIRLSMWKSSLDLYTIDIKNFFIGTGPETFPYEFQKVRSKELNYSSEWNFILNKPHNFYIETLVEEGILGLATYIAVLYLLFKRSTKDVKSSLVSFAVVNIFGWPTVATTLIFWIFLSFIDTETNTIDTNATQN